jgi:hypothetical protein
VQCDEEENKKLEDLGCVLVALEDRMEEHGVTWASCWESQCVAPISPMIWQQNSDVFLQKDIRLTRGTLFKP